MTLRRKTLLIVGLTIVLLMVILYAASRIILMGAFVELEEQSTRENVERALSALADELSNLDTTTCDWASWDDTYRFMEDVNQEYVESNLLDDTFVALRLNLMSLVDPSGDITFGKAFDLQNEQETAITESLLEQLSVDGLLLPPDELESDVTGIVLLAEGPMLVASRPILTSDDEGPMRGTLIMGRYLDSTEIDRLAEITHLSLMVQRFEDSQVPPDFEAMRTSWSEGAPIQVRPLNAESIGGYAVLEDIYGNPALVLRVDMPRQIYQQGQTTISYFMLSLLLVSMVFAAVTLLLLERQILRPLADLSTSVRGVRTSGELISRPPITGGDELSALGSEINSMLEALEQGQVKLRESEERYRTLFEESRDAINITTRDGQLLDANQSFLDLFGYTGEEMKALNVLDMYVHPLDRQRFQGEIEQKGAVRNYEVKLRKKDGTELDCLLTSTVRQAKDGSVAGYQGFIRDITEEKRAREALRESEEKYRNLVERANDGIAIIQDRIIKYANSRLAQMQGNTVQEIIDTSFTDYLDPDQLPKLLDRYQQRMAGEPVAPMYETVFRHKDGSKVYAEVNAGLVTYQGRPADLVIVRDITERKRAEEALRESEEHYRRLFDRVPVGLYRTTSEGQIIDANPALVHMLGYPDREALLAVDATEIFVDYDDRRREHALLEAEGVVRDFEMRLRRLDGAIIWIRDSSRAVRDAAHRVIYYEGSMEDITERKLAEETIRRLAYHDALTGLPNRALFIDRLDVALAHARRKQQEVAVMLLDLDHFKDVNDRLGHSVGDRLLQAVGERLTTLLRETDTVCRMGGDEFLLLLPEVAQVQNAGEVADKILEAVRKPLVLDDHELHITTSLGLAIYPDDGEDVDTLVRNADIAMYRAKDKGRDNYQRYIPLPDRKTTPILTRGQEQARE